MRKIVACSIIILLLGLFTSNVLAEDEVLTAQEECGFLKEFKAFKQLYGLCIAYQNADEDGRADIIRLWDKRIAELPVDVPFVPDMPNREVDIVYFDCPCWKDDLDSNKICEMRETSTFLPEFVGNSGSLFIENFSTEPPEIEFLAIYLSYEFVPDLGEQVLMGGQCEYTQVSPVYSSSSESMDGVGAGELAATCMAEIEIMADPTLCD